MTYGGEIYFLFLARKFSENLQRKWASKTVSVIVERRIDSNFHGLYSYRPKKWRENVQNFAVKPLACGYIVVLLEVLNTDVILWLIRVQTMENIIVVDLSSRFWRVPHYMAEKPNQSCHTFVKYVSKGCKKTFWSGDGCSTINKVKPFTYGSSSALPSICPAFLTGTLMGNPRFSAGNRIFHYR